MDNKVFIIAEAGVNHNGDIELARRLVSEAAKAGADAVKFQTFKAEKVMSRFAVKADYQKTNTGNDESQLEMVKKLQLPYEAFAELKRYSDELGIQFLSTPFDLDSIDYLSSLKLEIIKIPSGEITNLPYLIKVGKLFKKIILSTGMATLEDIGEAIRILKENGATEVAVLHCNTEYPTPYCDINLKAMETIRQTFDLCVGYSDHSLGIEVPIAAVAMGATIIEKHFTLDKNMEGPDHIASLEPQELASMVKAIRNVEAALGSAEKKPSASEIKNMVIARKSIIAKTDIKQGELLTEDNITVKRPGNGISPMRWFEILGQKAVRDFVEDELIEL